MLITLTLINAIINQKCFKKQIIPSYNYLLSGFSSSLENHYPSCAERIRGIRFCMPSRGQSPSAFLLYYHIISTTRRRNQLNKLCVRNCNLKQEKGKEGVVLHE